MGHGNGYDDYGGCGCDNCDVCGTVPTMTPFSTTLGSNVYSPIWDVARYHDATHDLAGNEIQLPPCGHWRLVAPHNCTAEIESELASLLVAGRFDSSGHFVGLPDTIETDKVVYLEVSRPSCTYYPPSIYYPDGLWRWGNVTWPSHPVATTIWTDDAKDLSEYFGDGIMTPQGRWYVRHEEPTCAQGLVDGYGSTCGKRTYTSSSFGSYVSNTGELVGLPEINALYGRIGLATGGNCGWTPSFPGRKTTAPCACPVVLEFPTFKDSVWRHYTLDLSAYCGPGIGLPGFCWGIAIDSQALPCWSLSFSDENSHGTNPTYRLLDSSGNERATVGPIDLDGTLIGIEPTMTLSHHNNNKNASTRLAKLLYVRSET